MTDEQRKRVHDITYNTQDREELAERIVRLEDENARLRSMRDRWQENDANLREENARLRDLVAHLMFVKPDDVSAILYKGELLRFEDLLAEVGMRWESEVY